MGCSCQMNQNTEKRNDAEIAPTRQGGKAGRGLPRRGPARPSLCGTVRE
jgi:hypothetical protein